MPIDFSELLSDFRQFAVQRIALFFNGNSGEAKTPPQTRNKISAHTNILQLIPSKDFSDEEYLILIIALVSHIAPNLFDDIIRHALPNNGDFPQLGGVRGKNFRGFLPTGETALFLLAGEDLEKRLEVQELFSPEHFFSKKRILWLEDVPSGEPRMSGKIILAQEYIDLFMTGKVSRPNFNAEFPAKLIETDMSWDDLVLDAEILAQIKELGNLGKAQRTDVAGLGAAQAHQTWVQGLVSRPSGDRQNIDRQSFREVYRKRGISN